VRCFSVVPVDAETYGQQERLLYRTAAREGVAL
jgi:hypothetical protein